MKRARTLRVGYYFVVFIGSLKYDILRSYYLIVGGIITVSVSVFPIKRDFILMLQMVNIYTLGPVLKIILRQIVDVAQC